jgi:hypothetical protein
MRVREGDLPKCSGKLTDPGKPAFRRPGILPQQLRTSPLFAPWANITAWACRENRKPALTPRSPPLSEAARSLLRRRLNCEEIEITDRNRLAYREPASAGIMIPLHTFAKGDVTATYRVLPCSRACWAVILRPHGWTWPLAVASRLAA